MVSPYVSQGFSLLICSIYQAQKILSDLINSVIFPFKHRDVLSNKYHSPFRFRFICLEQEDLPYQRGRGNLCSCTFSWWPLFRVNLTYIFLTNFSFFFYFDPYLIIKCIVSIIKTKYINFYLFITLNYRDKFKIEFKIGL